MNQNDRFAMHRAAALLFEVDNLEAHRLADKVLALVDAAPTRRVTDGWASARNLARLTDDELRQRIKHLRACAESAEQVGLFSVRSAMAALCDEARSLLDARTHNRKGAR